MAETWNHFGEESRITETGYKRIINLHGKDGFIIVSTTRSTVAPYDDDGVYDYASWQSLLDEYLGFTADIDEVFEKPFEGFSNKAEYVNYCTTNGIEPKPELEKEFLEKRNGICDRQLKDFLLSADNPFTFTPAYGGYAGLAGEENDLERSFFIYNSQNPRKPSHASWGNLLTLAMVLCERYKQDSVFVQAPGEAPHYLDKDGNRTDARSSKKTRYYMDDKGNNIDNDNPSFYSSIGRKWHLDDKGARKASKRMKADISFDPDDIDPDFKESVPFPFNQMGFRNHHQNMRMIEMRNHQGGEVRVRNDG